MENTEIIPILKEFFQISGFRISIHDLEYNEIYAYPQSLSPFCNRIQQIDRIRQQCNEMDKVAFEKVEQTEKTFVYQCHCGLYEAVAPIYHFGVLSGYLMMGQVRSHSSSSRGYILKKLIPFMDDIDEAQQYVDTIKSIDENLIYSYVTIMQLVAEHITRTNKINRCSNHLAPMIKQYINRNYNKTFSLSLLTQKFNCCSSTLMSCFKSEYHMTIIEYLHQVRLTQAEQMLTCSRKSVKEIAAACGFSGQNYFTRLFTKQYGISPVQYRTKKMKKD
ncbi:MAG: PocR ligand-binding domain-containing protein [Clostridiales bacterium]|nr:PocR ligand-binding domain-containing protein [Clostridiales bacterium]